MVMKSFFVICLVCVSFSLSSQTSSKQGLYWGVRIGGYFAHAKEADFYNGLHSEQSTLSSLLEQSIITMLLPNILTMILVYIIKLNNEI